MGVSLLKPLLTSGACRLMLGHHFEFVLWELGCWNLSLKARVLSGIVWNAGL